MGKCYERKYQKTVWFFSLPENTASASSCRTGEYGNLRKSVKRISTFRRHSARRLPGPLLSKSLRRSLLQPVRTTTDGRGRTRRCGCILRTAWPQIKRQLEVVRIVIRIFNNKYLSTISTYRQKAAVHLVWVPIACLAWINDDEHYDICANNSCTNHNGNIDGLRVSCGNSPDDR